MTSATIATSWTSSARWPDWEELLAGLHQRGIKLVMDLVVNILRMSIPGPRVRQIEGQSYRDYYIWRPPWTPRPNNWAYPLGGSAWQYDEATAEYYLHLFSRKQPDLNWRIRGSGRKSMR